jgi:hypothetical protein
MHSQKSIDNNFDLILQRIENGESLRRILKDIGIGNATFYKWIDSDSEKQKQYARALEERADLKFESIEQDYMENPQRDPETGRIDPAWVNLQRLKIDSKKWELSKLMPKKYGDKQETTHIFETPIFNGIDLNVQKDNSSGKDS